LVSLTEELMQEQQAQERQVPQAHTTADDENGGAWARDRAIIQPEEQPEQPPTAEQVKRAARQRDLASGEEDRGA
jgi:hypothetical protein